MTAEDRGIDALMAAITDEPVPDDKRADATFMTEHRKATADVALLREQLGIIGDALAEPPAQPSPAARSAPPRPVPNPRRAVRFAFRGLAVAAAASVVAGLGWLVATGAGGAMTSSDDADGGSIAKDSTAAESGTRFGSPHYLACTQLVVEAKIASVERLEDGVQLRITVDVVRYYKQDGQRPERLTYVVDDTFTRGLVRGDQVLFGVPKGDAVPDHWVVGEAEVARERAWIQASLPESRKLTCE
ncbi:hypothetical protein [Streptomyces sp. S.PB5]|uniref:hypothetical protein n=1 Tax=Streptomyces sp. S.PB5 TaxID=3020844 RepID=UPI0025AF6B85|nr:hypothetical protein [Streptomyces sp. S.PB5]MDN3022860.1 hypothetical protein [Streptomyces sp. S.PB5]